MLRRPGGAAGGLVRRGMMAMRAARRRSPRIADRACRRNRPAASPRKPAAGKPCPGQIAEMGDRIGVNEADAASPRITAAGAAAKITHLTIIDNRRQQRIRGKSTQARRWAKWPSAREAWQAFFEKRVAACLEKRHNRPIKPAERLISVGALSSRHGHSATGESAEIET